MEIFLPGGSGSGEKIFICLKGCKCCSQAAIVPEQHAARALQLSVDMECAWRKERRHFGFDLAAD
jgi:hypothetical protein